MISTVTGIVGMARLVYGLSKAGIGPDGISHWGDAVVLASLAASVILMIWCDRAAQLESPAADAGPRRPNRSDAYLIMLFIGTAMFGMFPFLTQFMQTVLGTARSGQASPTCRSPPKT